jgi:aminopeptidase N
VIGRNLAAAGVAVLVLLTGCTTTTPVLATVLCGPPMASAPAVAGSAFGPGGDGIGDTCYPKAGNGGYDVASYDLDLRYDPTTDTLTGSERITATATANLNQFNLDLKALTVDSVTIDGVAATAKPAGEELVVTPAKGIRTGTRFVTAIRYGGVPETYQEDGLGQVGFLHSADGAVAIGEPEVAASWFPVNDHPRDKATYTVRIAAPDGLTAMSNGVLKGKQSAAGWTTWSWAEGKPMAPYLATIVIGRYRVQESTHAGKPVFLAVDSSLDPGVDVQLARTPAIIDFLESKFGPYPFDAMGGIVIDDQRVRFALENQTRPIYSWAFFQHGEDGTWVIVHELAHQWYGDSVSINNWSEIWLNEGFATYAEWLWAEYNGGQSAQRTFDAYYGRADSPIWKVPPGNPGKAELFGSSVYTRGGMTLHALRLRVGDGAFFKILKAWAAEKANGNATTTEFIALAERISGKQLDQLFNDWLYGKVRPPNP